MDLKEIEGKMSNGSDQTSVDAKDLSEKISQLESQLEQLSRSWMTRFDLGKGHVLVQAGLQHLHQLV